MKKITIALTLALTLTLTLAACGGDINVPAANDAPQVRETAEPTPTETPMRSPTPDPTPEAAPDDNSGTDNPGTAIGESFFPNIDDSYLPDDIIKFTVGTLASSGDAMPEEEGLRPFFLRFEDITEDDYKELVKHYESGDVLSSNEITQDIDNERNTYQYSWGKIKYTYYFKEGIIEVVFSVKQS